MLLNVNKSIKCSNWLKWFQFTSKLQSNPLDHFCLMCKQVSDDSESRERTHLAFPSRENKINEDATENELRIREKKFSVKSSFGLGSGGVNIIDSGREVRKELLGKDHCSLTIGFPKNSYDLLLVPKSELRRDTYCLFDPSDFRFFL